MMLGSVSHWIARLKTGDARAPQEIWERYFGRLLDVARRKLRGVPRREADEEDVVVCAFKSFYEGVQQGDFPRLDDRDDLWQLLVVIADRKAANQRKRSRRQKRGGGKLRGESVFRRYEAEEPWPTLNGIIGKEPTPEFAAMVVDEIDHLLRRLSSESLRTVAVCKMQGWTNQEIADDLGCTARTVERKLKLIRQHLCAE